MPQPSTTQLILQVVTSGHFLGVLLLVVFGLVGCVCLATPASPTGGLGWVDELLDEEAAVEIAPQRQEALAAKAVPDVFAPTAIAEADPSRARTTLRGVSDSPRERLVRRLNARYADEAVR